MSDDAIVGSAKIDGTIYCIPRKSYPSQEWTSMDREIAYRWDLAKKAGITKEPTTWKEFDPDDSGYYKSGSGWNRNSGNDC